MEKEEAHRPGRIPCSRPRRRRRQQERPKMPSWTSELPACRLQEEEEEEDLSQNDGKTLCF